MLDVDLTAVSLTVGTRTSPDTKSNACHSAAGAFASTRPSRPSMEERFVSCDRINDFSTARAIHREPTITNRPGSMSGRTTTVRLNCVSGDSAGSKTARAFRPLRSRLRPPWSPRADR